MQIAKGLVIGDEEFILESAQSATFDSDGRRIADIMSVPDFPAYDAGTSYKAMLRPNTDTGTWRLEWVKDRIETDSLVPDNASLANQLADKAYVDYNTEQVAAKYLASDAAGNPFPSHAAFAAAGVKFYYAGEEAEPTKNDYVLINGDESRPEEEWISDLPPITRYWFTGTSWSFQYVVNNSPLNASQLAAINSTITKDIVDSVKDLPTDELMTLPTEVNQYLHDQNCIQFKTGDNVAMVIMDELAKHTFPYSCKFMSPDSGVSKTLKQLPAPETKLGTNTQDMAGFIITAYCMGGSGTEADIPDYRRYAYLELSQQARNVNDLCRFKYWCRLANNTQARPAETSQYAQLHWQRALTDNNYGFASVRELATNDNLVGTIMTDFAKQFRPYHGYYTCTDSKSSSIKGVPSELSGAFSVHAYAPDGDNGLDGSPKYKMKLQVELVGTVSDGSPVKYVGCLNYTSTGKPSTWPALSWRKVGLEVVTSVRT